MDTHIISTTHSEGMVFNSSVNDHSVVTDSITGNDIESKGPGPKRLMLVALAGCTGIDVVSILNKMKVVFTNFSIDTEATLTDQDPKIYSHVKVSYKINLAETDRPKMEKAVHLSVDKYCGVMAMFKTFAKVETEIIYL